MKRVKLKLLTTVLILFTAICIAPWQDGVYTGTLKSAYAAPKKSKRVKTETVNSKKQLVKSFIKHITGLDKHFKFKISKRVMKNKDKAFIAFWSELAKYPEYNEIVDYSNLIESDSFSVTQDYRNYFIWELKVKYSISKADAKKRLENITPILKTKEEIIDSMVAHAANLDENFSIYVDKKAFNMEDDSEYNKLWDRLYDIPEFNDISRYYSDFASNHSSYKTYYKWNISTKYDITKEELDYLNNFVKNWVAEKITPSMTDEEKVRAINDFMVAEYRYTFGDKGQCPLDDPYCPEEKLGKYSVYSSFSLVYGKGGVCDAKAKLFYRLAKEAGLNVIYVTGKVPDGLHAWNLVKVNGSWYHIDVTWNRGHYEWSAENEYYNTRDYYLKSDSTMQRRDHIWDKSKYPAANSDYPLENVPEAPNNTSGGSTKKAA